VVLCTAVAAIALGACGDDGTSPATKITTTAAGGSAGAGGGGGQGGKTDPQPGPELERFCDGKDWQTTSTAAVVGELGGAYKGVVNVDPPLDVGTLHTMKVVPAHPFFVKKIRLAFGGKGGMARIRLMTTFGRSYPGGWPDIEAAEANLIEPVDFMVADEPDPEEWIEIDVSDLGVFLQPTQHYVLVYEQLGLEPRLAVEELTDKDEASRAMIHVPGEDTPWGLGPVNYRMQLSGDSFCAWTESERWFGVAADTPFAQDKSPRVAVSDLNGDGHDDVVVIAPGPIAYFGDGNGSFTAAGFDPFQDTPRANMLVFGDLDNDGDRDAFASTYVSADADGDGVTVAEGDCNDAEATVKPGAKEVDNGFDDDCDGVADDGSDSSDADMDGYGIDQGDCDDTQDTVFPGAPELLDQRDNDCDLEVDEDFVNRILLNDASGKFTALANSGVEQLDPSPAAAFGDGNGDGFLDLHWGNWLEHYPDAKAVQDRYFVGQGDGSFVDTTEKAGLITSKPRPCYGVGWNDYDNDGHQDILVSNYQLVNNYLWRNQGDGTFIDVASKVHVDHDDIPSPYVAYPGGHSYGATWGDIDHDGDMDLFQTNLSHPRTRPWSDPSMLLINGGAPDFSFTDEREKRGIIYDEGDVNAAFADYDNDGDLDLVVATLYSTHYSKLYRNDGEMGFVDVTYETGTAVHDAVSAVWSDVDEDGDLDLFIADRAAAPNVQLFINRVGQDNNWLQLDLVGSSSNRDAVGARVALTTDGVTRLREVTGGSGHSNTQQTRIVHFGLGKKTDVSTLTVRWVGGATEQISGAAVNGRYRIVEGSGKAVPIGS